MALVDILIGLFVGLVVAASVYLIMKMQLRHRIAMVEKEFRKDWAEQESSVRKDAADRSRYVIKGKIAEHMVPMIISRMHSGTLDLLSLLSSLTVAQ